MAIALSEELYLSKVKKRDIRFPNLDKDKNGNDLRVTEKRKYEIIKEEIYNCQYVKAVAYKKGGNFKKSQ